MIKVADVSTRHFERVGEMWPVLHADCGVGQWVLVCVDVNGLMNCAPIWVYVSAQRYYISLKLWVLYPLGLYLSLLLSPKRNFIGAYVWFLAKPISLVNGYILILESKWLINRRKLPIIGRKYKNSSYKTKGNSGTTNNKGSGSANLAASFTYL